MTTKNNLAVTTKIIVTVITLLSIPTKTNAQTILCVEDKSVGFSVSSNWEQKTFKANEKFIIRPKNKSEVDLVGAPISEPFVFSPIGYKKPLGGCFYYSSGKFIKCEGGLEWVMVGIGDMRFEKFSYGGYPGSTDRDNVLRQDVAVSIGKCSKLN